MNLHVHNLYLLVYFQDKPLKVFFKIFNYQKKSKTPSDDWSHSDVSIFDIPLSFLNPDELLLQIHKVSPCITEEVISCSKEEILVKDDMMSCKSFVNSDGLTTEAFQVIENSLSVDSNKWENEATAPLQAVEKLELKPPDMGKKTPGKNGKQRASKGAKSNSGRASRFRNDAGKTLIAPSKISLTKTSSTSLPLVSLASKGNSSSSTSSILVSALSHQQLLLLQNQQQQVQQLSQVQQLYSFQQHNTTAIDLSTEGAALPLNSFGDTPFGLILDNDNRSCFNLGAVTPSNASNMLYTAGANFNINALSTFNLGYGLLPVASSTNYAESLSAANTSTNGAALQGLTDCLVLGGFGNPLSVPNPGLPGTILPYGLSFAPGLMCVGQPITAITDSSAPLAVPNQTCNIFQGGVLQSSTFNIAKSAESTGASIVEVPASSACSPPPSIPSETSISMPSVSSQKCSSTVLDPQNEKPLPSHEKLPVSTAISKASCSNKKDIAKPVESDSNSKEVDPHASKIPSIDASRAEWKEVQLKISELGVMSVSGEGDHDFMEGLISQVESETSELLSSIESDGIPPEAKVNTIAKSDVSNGAASSKENSDVSAKYDNHAETKVSSSNTKETLSKTCTSPSTPAKLSFVQNLHTTSLSFCPVPSYSLAQKTLEENTSCASNPTVAASVPNSSRSAKVSLASHSTEPITSKAVDSEKDPLQLVSFHSSPIAQTTSTDVTATSHSCHSAASATVKNTSKRKLEENDSCDVKKRLCLKDGNDGKRKTAPLEKDEINTKKMKSETSDPTPSHFDASIEPIAKEERPLINRKTSKLKEIAEKQKLTSKCSKSVSSESPTKDDLKRITDTVNNMTEQISFSFPVAVASKEPKTCKVSDAKVDSVLKTPTKKSHSFGYKTLNTSPKGWNPTISRDLIQMGVNSYNTPKTNKFFKARNASKVLPPLPITLPRESSHNNDVKTDGKTLSQESPNRSSVACKKVSPSKSSFEKPCDNKASSPGPNKKPSSKTLKSTITENVDLSIQREVSGDKNLSPKLTEQTKTPAKESSEKQTACASVETKSLAPPDLSKANDTESDSKVNPIISVKETRVVASNCAFPLSDKCSSSKSASDSVSVSTIPSCAGVSRNLVISPPVNTVSLHESKAHVGVESCVVSSASPTVTPSVLLSSDHNSRLSLDKKQVSSDHNSRLSLDKKQVSSDHNSRLSLDKKQVSSDHNSRLSLDKEQVSSGKCQGNIEKAGPTAATKSSCASDKSVLVPSSNHLLVPFVPLSHWGPSRAPHREVSAADKSCSEKLSNSKNSIASDSVSKSSDKVSLVNSTDRSPVSKGFSSQTTARLSTSQSNVSMVVTASVSDKSPAESVNQTTTCVSSASSICSHSSSTNQLSQSCEQSSLPAKVGDTPKVNDSSLLCNVSSYPAMSFPFMNPSPKTPSSSADDQSLLGSSCSNSQSSLTSTLSQAAAEPSICSNSNSNIDKDSNSKIIPVATSKDNLTDLKTSKCSASESVVSKELVASSGVVTASTISQSLSLLSGPLPLTVIPSAHQPKSAPLPLVAPSLSSPSTACPPYSNIPKLQASQTAPTCSGSAVYGLNSCTTATSHSSIETSNNDANPKDSASSKHPDAKQKATAVANEKPLATSSKPSCSQMLVSKSLSPTTPNAPSKDKAKPAAKCVVATSNTKTKSSSSGNKNLSVDSQMLHNYQMLNTPYALSNFMSQNALQQNHNFLDPFSAYTFPRNLPTTQGNNYNSFQSPSRASEIAGYGYSFPNKHSSDPSKQFPSYYNSSYFNSSQTDSNPSVNAKAAALNAYLAANINYSSFNPSYAMANFPYFMSNSFPMNMMQSGWNSSIGFGKSSSSGSMANSPDNSNCSGASNNNSANFYSGFYYNQNTGGYSSSGLNSNCGAYSSSYPYLSMSPFNHFPSTSSATATTTSQSSNKSYSTPTNSNAFNSSFLLDKSQHSSKGGSARHSSHKTENYATNNASHPAYGDSSAQNPTSSSAMASNSANNQASSGNFLHSTSWGNSHTPYPKTKTGAHPNENTHGANSKANSDHLTSYTNSLLSGFPNQFLQNQSQSNFSTSIYSQPSSACAVNATQSFSSTSSGVGYNKGSKASLNNMFAANNPMSSYSTQSSSYNNQNPVCSTPATNNSGINQAISMQSSLLACSSADKILDSIMSLVNSASSKPDTPKQQPPTNSQKAANTGMPNFGCMQSADEKSPPSSSYNSKDNQYSSSTFSSAKQCPSQSFLTNDSLKSLTSFVSDTTPLSTNSPGVQMNNTYSTSGSESQTYSLPSCSYPNVDNKTSCSQPEQKSKSPLKLIRPSLASKK